jgi:tetratricopeptide (TPR) repeat protein
MQARFSALTVAVVLALLGATGTAREPDKDKPARPAPMFKRMGNLRFPVSTRSRLGQRYIDQGMTLSFGFNHAEAARSFREAQKLDPQCAMAFWGEALVLGPNINMPMQDANVPLAWAAIQKAQKLAPRATPRERDYIAALATRYQKEPAKDRSPLDKAYADAMRKLAEKYPDDYDAQVLFAESLMDTTPWDYWLEGGKPKPLTEELLRTLERVLARAPNHPGACHLYIHAVEAAHPEWAEACADRLRKLVPGAGHLVHMPSHIYIRIGRYTDARVANEKAVAADNDYVTQCHAQGIYPLGYMPHNHHFLWFAASMEGRAEQSIRAARHVAKHTDQKTMRQPGMGTLQHFYSMEMYALARFGRWKEIRALAKPADDLKYPTGVWHFVQGMATLRGGDADKAREHLAGLKKLAADPDLDKVTIWENNTTRHILQVGEQILAGEIAAADKDFDSAVAHLRKAVELEDAMRYEEPQLWYYPTRQALGAVLLEAGKPAEAEAIFRADLKRYPDNGWSLFGLQQSLEAQKKTAQAREAARRFKEVWKHADVKLTRPRF